MTKLDVAEIMMRVAAIEIQNLVAETYYSAGDNIQGKQARDRVSKYKQELRDMLDNLVTE